MEILALFWDIIVHLDKHLAALLVQYGPWIYVILFAIIFCETGLVVAPFLPGDSLLFVAGALCATGVAGASGVDSAIRTGVNTGGMDILILNAALIAAAIIGNSVNYAVGRYFGPRVFQWENSRFFNREALEKTHAYYELHGGKTLILTRFLPLFRTFAPFVAGIGKMPYGRFQFFNITGGILWVTSLTLLGYWFGNMPFIKNNLTVVIFAIVGLSLLPAVVGYLKHRFSSVSS